MLWLYGATVRLVSMALRGDVASWGQIAHTPPQLGVSTPTRLYAYRA